ncbi:hypothetical protein QAD02_014474 [Eretmocerus hayati]|uniref:Uncharacterized protein n=1 Tax=Eretmocerus hayati TaxID=131215 RepID=A0ACC2P8A2_9HYME|nr:hypothetical protein QAD02_014474 [Eretmocerus hayati]
MLALVLLGGLLLSSTTAAPNLCSGSCDDSKFGGSAYGRRSSYSSLSSMGSSRGYSTGGSSLGSRGGRLETLDDNVVQTFGSGLNLDRPGNWNEKKHIVTDDGHGEMNYEAGQTVTGNGYSKFSKHSYRYGSQDKHEPRSDSQILSVSDFNNEVQNLRQRINSFMGSYRSDSASLIDAGFMRDFRGKADLISSQLNDVCDQVSKGSSQWNQMQRMIKDFESQYEQKRSELQTRYQQQLESRYSGSSSGGSYHSESSYRQEQRHEYPKEVPPLEPLIKPSFPCQDLVREFYREFNRADTSEQYQQQLNTRSELIREKLAELKLEAGQREQQLSEVTTLEAQFGSFVGQLRERIHKFEAQQREEEQRYQERLRQIEEDKRRDEERLRQLESRQEEERRKQAQLEQQKLRLEQQRLQLEKEARETQERLESERIQVEQIEKNRSEKQQRLESERAQLLQQQRKMQQQLQQPVPTPELPDVEIVGTDSDLRKQHSSSSSQGSSSSTFEASYNMSSSSSSSSTMHVESSGNSGSSSSANLQRQQQQRVIEPHVDMTARVSRLQQDLNRLNNEINAFKIQSAQLSSENSISVVPQLNGQAESLRKEIQGLCDKSERYHSDDALQNARELKARFEAEFGRFQSSLSELSSSSSFTSSSSSSSNQQEMQQVQQQLGDFSSGSSWSSSGRVSHVKPPRLTKMELEHSRSVEVEMGSRPAPVIGSRSSYSGSSGYSASSSYGSAGGSAGESSSRYSSDCVEASAGQPCVGQLQHQRRRRQAPDEYGADFDFGDWKTDFSQRRRPISNIPLRYSRVPELSEYRPITAQLKNYVEQQPTSQIGILQLDRLHGNVRELDLRRASSSKRNPALESYRLRTTQSSMQDFREYQRHKVDESAENQSEFDGFYKSRGEHNRYVQDARDGDSSPSQRIQEQSQQTVSTIPKENDDFDSFQIPRSENERVFTDVRNRFQNPAIRKFAEERNHQDVEAQQIFEEIDKSGINKKFRTFENSQKKSDRWTTRPSYLSESAQNIERIGSKINSKNLIEQTSTTINPHHSVKVDEFEEVDSDIPLVVIEESTETKPKRYIRPKAVSDELAISQSGSFDRSNGKSHNEDREFAFDEIPQVVEATEKNQGQNSGQSNYGFVQKPEVSLELTNFEDSTEANVNGNSTRETIGNFEVVNDEQQREKNGKLARNDAFTSIKTHPNGGSRSNETPLTSAPDTEKLHLNHPNADLFKQKMQNLSYHHYPQELHLSELSENRETLYPYEHKSHHENTEHPMSAENKISAPTMEETIKPYSNLTPGNPISWQATQAHKNLQVQNNEKNDKVNGKPVPLRGDLPGISDPAPPEPLTEQFVSEIPTVETTTETKPEINTHVDMHKEDRHDKVKCPDCFPKQQVENINLDAKNSQHDRENGHGWFRQNSNGVHEINHKSHFHQKYQFVQKTKTNNYEDYSSIQPDKYMNRPFNQQSSEKYWDKRLQQTENRFQDSFSNIMFQNYGLHLSNSDHREFQTDSKLKNSDQINFSRFHSHRHSNQLNGALRNYELPHWFDCLGNTEGKKAFDS